MAMPDKINLNARDFPHNYRFMEVLVKDENGKIDNSKFFIGRLPESGEAVEMVFTGLSDDGSMSFQLRVRD